MANVRGFTFIDLFAGIGGIRSGFEAAGGRCVFSSEWDRFAQKTYEAFYGEVPFGDITKIDPIDIPDHDVLTGGFPCQPFSLAGVSKKQSLGRAHGFDDPTQGTLFFNVKEIILAKQPKAFLLENVKNLVSHDQGNTFRVIRDSLEKECGYRLFYKVIDSAGWVPQHRERIYLVGFRPDLQIGESDFCWPEPPVERMVDLSDVISKCRVSSKYTLGDGTWSTLERHKANHEAKGQGFGYGLIRRPFKNKVTRTISARYHKDGAEILIDQGGDRNPRRLTPLECLRLQGFPEKFERYYNGAETQPVSDTQAYRQFGNSVSVPVVSEIAKKIVATIVYNHRPEATSRKRKVRPVQRSDFLNHA